MLTALCSIICFINHFDFFNFVKFINENFYSACNETVNFVLKFLYKNLLDKKQKYLVINKNSLVNQISLNFLRLNADVGTRTNLVLEVL